MAGAILFASCLASNASAGLFTGGSEAAFHTTTIELLSHEFTDKRPPDASAGTTTETPSGWRASLFVSHVFPSPAVVDDVFRIRPSTFVGARLSRPLTKTTRVSFDVFNLFDHRGAELDYFIASQGAGASFADNYLFAPGEPRGFRITLRKTF